MSVTSNDPNEEMLEMGLLEHLNELRKRVTWAAIFLVVATMLSFAIAEPVLDFLLVPYESASAGAQLQTLRPTEGIETFFKVALMIGGIVSMTLLMS